MFDGSTEDLSSYIPGYDEYLEELEKEQETKVDYDTYVDMLIDEQILERLEKEKNEQKRKETI